MDLPSAMEDLWGLIELVAGEDQVRYEKGYQDVSDALGQRDQLVKALQAFLDGFWTYEIITERGVVPKGTLAKAQWVIDWVKGGQGELRRPIQKSHPSTGGMLGSDRAGAQAGYKMWIHR